LSLPDVRKHVVSFKVANFGEEFDVQAQATAVQSVQVFPSDARNVSISA
jgi:hypothetical protein